MKKSVIILTFLVSAILICAGCSVDTSDSKYVKIKNETISIGNKSENADFELIQISFSNGYSRDKIVLGEGIMEIPFNSSTKAFKLAKFETSYNTWYVVYKWALQNGYNIVNKGSEGLYGSGVEDQKNMNPGGDGAEPKLVQMPVCNLTWRDALVWCNALSEYKKLQPVYYSDKDFKNPIKDSTGPGSLDLKDYLITPGQIDNPYVNTKANGFRLPYNVEWEYAARKKSDTSSISGRNVPGDETGAMFEKTAIEEMNQLEFSVSKVFADYIWWRKNSQYDCKKTVSGLEDTVEKLRQLTGNNSIGGFRTHLSGGKKPSSLGFYDLSGNVPEWCFDYNTNYGSQYKFSTMRVCRGGDHVNESFPGNPSHCSGFKGAQLVGLTGGFRIAQNVE